MKEILALPHNSSAALAMPFSPSAACRFLDLPPVNLRNLQLHLTKNSFATAPTHLCGVALVKKIRRRRRWFLSGMEKMLRGSGFCRGAGEIVYAKPLNTKSSPLPRGCTATDQQTLVAHRIQVMLLSAVQCLPIFLFPLRGVLPIKQAAQDEGEQHETHDPQHE